MLNGGEERRGATLFSLGANNAAAPCRFLAYSAVQKTKKKYGLKSAAIRSATLQITDMGYLLLQKKGFSVLSFVTHACDRR